MTTRIAPIIQWMATLPPTPTIEAPIVCFVSAPGDELHETRSLIFFDRAPHTIRAEWNGPA